MALMDLFRSKPDWQHDDWKVRRKAVGNLKSYKLLEAISRNDHNEHVRKQATNVLKIMLRKRKAKDHKLLAYIATTATDADVRATAVCLLAERLMGKVKDQEFLIDIATSDIDWVVRRNAVAHLKDQESLEHIAKNDGNENVRIAAVQNLESHSLLADISRDDEHYNVRKVAKSVRKRLIEETKDQRVLGDIAKNDEDIDVRRLAVNRLSDQAILGDIAKNDGDESIRDTAVSRLEPNHAVRSEFDKRKKEELEAIEKKRSEHYYWCPECNRVGPILASSQSTYAPTRAQTLWVCESCHLELGKLDDLRRTEEEFFRIIPPRFQYLLD